MIGFGLKRDSKMKISINYSGGAHGHLLALACNYVFAGCELDHIGRTTSNGTYHGKLNTNLEEIEKSRRICVSFPYWWGLDRLAQRLAPVAQPLYNNVITITTTEVEELVLLRMYWRRRGDCFGMSPKGLAKATRHDLISLYSSRKVQNHGNWQQGDDLNNETTRLMYENAYSIFKDDYTLLTEMQVILFWTNPYMHRDRFDWEWMNTASKEWSESLPETTTQTLFQMNWFYDPVKFLAGIKQIGKSFNLNPLVSDQEIMDIIIPLKSNIQEFPDLELVFSKFDDVKNGLNTSLAELSLNDKIALVTVLQLHYRIYNSEFDHLLEFPLVTQPLIDIINKKIQ